MSEAVLLPIESRDWKGKPIRLSLGAKSCIPFFLSINLDYPHKKSFGADEAADAAAALLFETGKQASAEIQSINHKHPTIEEQGPASATTLLAVIAFGAAEGLRQQIVKGSDTGDTAGLPRCTKPDTILKLLPLALDPAVPSPPSSPKLQSEAFPRRLHAVLDALSPETKIPVVGKVAWLMTFAHTITRASQTVISSRSLSQCYWISLRQSGCFSC